MKSIIISVILIYMLLLFVVAYWSNKKIKNNDDYLIAGRSTSFIIVAITIAATEIGGGSSISIIEKSYGNWGMSAIWYVLAMAAAFATIALFAPKMREVEVTTIPEYFRRRYGESSSILTSIIMVFPLIGLAVSQFIVGASILNSVFGINYHISVTLVAFIIIVYTYMGGYYGISRAHIMQFAFLLIGSILTLVFLLTNTQNLGGFFESKAVIRQISQNKIGFQEILSLIVMYIASFSVGQELMPGLYSSKTGKDARKGSLIAAIITIAFSFLPVGIGLILFFNNVNNSTALNGDVTNVVLNGLNGVIPPVVISLFFVGILAAAMSSADSDIFGAASIIGNDIYRMYINKKPTESQALAATRNIIIIVGISALFVALFSKTNVIQILMLSFTLRAGGVFIPYILGHYWKDASSAGALAAIISGSAVVIVMEQSGKSILGFGPAVPSVIVSLIAFVLFSKLIPNKTSSTTLKEEEKYSEDVEEFFIKTDIF